MTFNEQMKISQRIAERRNELHMTQEDFVDKAGIGVRTLQRAENCKLPRDIKIWIALAECLDTSLDYLIWGDEKPKIIS